MKLPLLTILFAFLVWPQPSAAQSPLAEAVTAQVLLWLCIQDGDPQPATCAYTREELDGGVFAMEVHPLSLPGIDLARLYHVQVNPMHRVMPGEAFSFPRTCLHDHAAPQTWVVAQFADSSFGFVSGPGLLDAHGRLSQNALSDLDLARLRLAYLDPTRLRVRARRPNLVKVAAFSQTLNRHVTIRFRGNGRVEFEISETRAMGLQSRVLKPYRYDGGQMVRRPKGRKETH